MINALKGTKDILPEESYKWQYIEGVMRKIAGLFGYYEARTPVIEYTELFLRGVGDTTDIVQKEMYTFSDKGDRCITLKPEGTAGVVRAFLNSGLYAAAQPTKLYYLNCPVFRNEKPQAGRLREHHQFGVEVFGAQTPSIDAEVIALALTLFRELKISGLELNINSIGCPECRPDYNKKLIAFLDSKKSELCPTCNERLLKNPLRILDCKEEKCKKVCAGAPKLMDNLCASCESHFEGVKQRLDVLNIPFSINPYIVRGLDYYSKTVFEIISTSIGAQGTVCGGGRYDGLVSQLGGPSMAGIGFGLGMERLLLVMESQGIDIPHNNGIQVFVATMGEKANLYGFNLCHEFRQKGIACDCDHGGKSLKAQFKYADKLKAQYVVVIGENELESGILNFKNMATGEELKINKQEILNILEK